MTPLWFVMLGVLVTAQAVNGALAEPGLLATLEDPQVQGMRPSVRPRSLGGHAALGTAQMALYVAASAQPPVHIPASADISVSRIFLNEPESARKALGVPTPSPREDVLRLCNRTKTELLLLVFHPGNVVDSYSEFRVRSVPESPPACVVLAGVGRFVSGKGIRLGISRKTLVGILGPGFSERTEGSDAIVHYAIQDFGRSSFLRHYNMPVYFGSYRFRNGKLVEFAFGFEYP